MMRLRREDGQATVVVVVAMTAVLGVTGLVIDAGAWFRAHRSAQAVADAGALAGAQDLPLDTASAREVARDYISRNGGDLEQSSVDIQTTYRANDTVRVAVQKPVEGLFTRLFGLGSFHVTGTAKAVVELPASAVGVAPFAVDRRHEYLIGPGCPCLNKPTELDLDKLGPGAFKVIDVDGSSGGISPSVLADWIRNGYGGTVGLGWYYNDPGAKFNPSQVQDALRYQTGHDLMFPVYGDMEAVGSNFRYKIVGWTGFHITNFDFHGSSGILQGWFSDIVWDAEPTSDSTQFDYGAHTVRLAE